jgi:hypothetical protein
MGRRSDGVRLGFCESRVSAEPWSLQVTRLRGVLGVPREKRDESRLMMLPFSAFLRMDLGVAQSLLGGTKSGARLLMWLNARAEARAVISGEYAARSPYENEDVRL